MHNKSSKIPQRAYELNPVLRDGHLEKQVAKGAILDNIGDINLGDIGVNY